MIPEASFANLTLIEEQYEKYCANPKGVDPSWLKFFEGFNNQTGSKTKNSIIAPSVVKEMKPVEEISQISREESHDLRVYNLIEAYRTYGHLFARINPINTRPLEEPLELKLTSHSLNSNDLSHFFPTYGLLPEKTAPLSKIVEVLKHIYCNNIGVEYKGLGNPELENWLQQCIEPNQFKINLSIEQKQMILNDLNKSELLESFLHTKYVGQKRFSLEGAETLIPMLTAVIDTAALVGLKDLVIGMAHRGRLNVLCNILNKSYAEIFSEFDESYIPNSFEGSGDVKYHKGFTAEFHTQHNKVVRVDLIPNPSHLESVNPVVEGQVNASQKLLNDAQKNIVIPVLIHGDAAVSGQGIVYETMQLSKLKGYETGGTLHFVINNQIGFTTAPKDARSTYYCTDIAKAFGAPVFHVNAEDPEGCVYVANLAIELRQRFHCDVFIDLFCYRKYGHNESDEPAFTQPLEYQLIRKKKPIRELYRDILISQGLLEKHMAEHMEIEFKKSLQQALLDSSTPIKKENKNKLNGEANITEAKTDPLNTAVSKSILQEITEHLSNIPKEHNVHPKLQHLINDRRAMVMDGEKPLDWGMGETLAYGSLLWEGIDVRLSGQDCERGTFSHRHAVLMDQITGEAYCPLKHLKSKQGHFDIYNSPLSEMAVLGFELGYCLGNPKALVIWEAQFGDFANGAQTIIDQYLVSGEKKWMQKVGLVLYLPHGYEGQGPDHSTGRIERFLQLAGDNNMNIVNPTQPAQLFHLIRRQALEATRKPLIVFTPKGLLRHPECVNPLSDFTSGEFKRVIDDSQKPSKINKIVLCSGRIYFDLNSARMKKKVEDLIILRVEQLYPFPTKEIKDYFDKYKGFSEVIWVQEEPANMGAWEFARGELMPLLPKNSVLNYVGRGRSATTAVGSHALHKKEHAELIDAIFKDYEVRLPTAASEIKKV